MASEDPIGAAQGQGSGAPQYPAGEFISIVGNSAYQARRNADGTVQYKSSSDPSGWVDFTHLDQADTVDASKAKSSAHIVNMGDRGVYSVTWDEQGNPIEKMVQPPDYVKLGLTDAKDQAEISHLAASTALAQSAKANGDSRTSAYVSNVNDLIAHRSISSGQAEQRLQLAIDKFKASVDSPLTRAKTAQATSQATLNDAKANVAVAPIGAKMEGEIARLQEIESNEIKNNPGQEAQIHAKYRQLKDDVFATAKREYEQGLAGKDAATAANDAFKEEVTQANSRANTADSYMEHAMTTGADIVKAGGYANAAGPLIASMLKAGPGFLASMGGAPVATPPALQGFMGRTNSILGGTPTPDQARSMIQDIQANRALYESNPQALAGLMAKYALGSSDNNGSPQNNDGMTKPDSTGSVPPGYLSAPDGGPTGPVGTPQSFLSLAGN